MLAISTIQSLKVSPSNLLFNLLLTCGTSSLALVILENIPFYRLLPPQSANHSQQVTLSQQPPHMLGVPLMSK